MSKREYATYSKRSSPDGSWTEQNYTGTGFPSVFYLKYDLYRQYFPLLALAEYAKATGGPVGSSDRHSIRFNE